MANIKDVKAQPKKIVLSDGKQRTMRFTLNALAELEDRYGTVEDAFKALEANSFKAIRCVLWAGLLHESPNLTETEVGNLIDTDSLQELMETLGESLKSDLPEADENVPVELTVVPQLDRTDIDPN